MSDILYPDCLRDLIESEIFGEAVSLALLEVAKTERDRYHFATLLQLETETKARLRPLLYTHGVPLSEQHPTEQVNAVVEGYLASTWEEFAAANKEVVENFLARRKARSMQSSNRSITQFRPESTRILKGGNVLLLSGD